MKKSRSMRLASALLVLTLLSTCMISGTFAKYVTKATGTDTARVAKWGVEITANGTTFANAYQTDDTTVTTFANSVVAVDVADNIVAPGTKGTMAKMTLSGRPEVAVRVNYKANLELSNNWMIVNDSTSFYCPIEITVGTTTIKGTEYTAKESFEKAVEDAIASYTKTYEANTELNSDTVKGESLAIEWSWPFYVSDENDLKDTALGNLANAPTIKLEIETTVTQID